jgi:ATP phosphoribosyltransferase
MRHHRVTSMLSIAIPKGSLEEQTFLLFKQADLEISTTRG